MSLFSHFAGKRISSPRIRICLKFRVEPRPERSEGRHSNEARGDTILCAGILVTNSDSNELMSEDENLVKKET